MLSNIISRIKKLTDLQNWSAGTTRDQLSLIQICCLWAIFLFEQGCILVTPIDHGIDDRNQRHPQCGNGILRTWWQFRIDHFGHQSIFHQLFKLQIQHTRRCLTGEAHWDVKPGDATHPKYRTSTSNRSNSWSTATDNPNQQVTFFRTWVNTSYRLLHPKDRDNHPKE